MFTSQGHWLNVLEYTSTCMVIQYSSPNSKREEAVQLLPELQQEAANITPYYFTSMLLYSCAVIFGLSFRVLVHSKVKLRGGRGSLASDKTRALKRPTQRLQKLWTTELTLDGYFQEQFILAIEIPISTFYAMIYSMLAMFA